jgi:hypothetical protein
MLFLAFLDIEFRPGSFHKGILWVVLANIVIAFAGYGILRPFSLDLALTAFITGIAPTAIAAPVIIGFLQGQVEFVAAAVLLGNLTISLVLPVALPFVVGDVVEVSIWQVLRPVLVTMLTPIPGASLSPAATNDSICDPARKGVFLCPVVVGPAHFNCQSLQHELLLSCSKHDFRCWSSSTVAPMPRSNSIDSCQLS